MREYECIHVFEKSVETFGGTRPTRPTSRPNLDAETVVNSSSALVRDDAIATLHKSKGLGRNLGISNRLPFFRVSYPVLQRSNPCEWLAEQNVGILEQDPFRERVANV